MKKIIYLIIGLLICTPAYAQVRVFTPSQGGTGISSVTAGDIGYCLKVLSATPFAYELGSCGSGGGGSGGGSWSTTTSSVTGRLINYPNNTTDIVVIGGTATTTGASEYWFDPNTQNAHIGSSNTASTSVMGLFLLPTVGQGFLYGGTGGNVNAIASSSVRLSWFNNDAGFITSSASTTLLSDTNSWSGRNTFANSTSTNLGATNFNANSSAGMNLHANNGTDIAIFGAGNTANTTFYGGVNIDGTTRLATSLTGLAKLTSGTVSTASAGTDYVAPATTITVNGTTNQITSSAGAQDLSANRTWTLSFPNQVIFPQYASSTSGFSTPYASSTNAFFGSLNVGSLTGILKASSGVVGIAVSGTDFKTINGSSILGAGDLTVTGGSGLSSSTPWTFGSLVVAKDNGSVTTISTSTIKGSEITNDLGWTSGGGGGSGTISTTTPLVSGQVAFSTGVSTIGNDSNFTFDSATDKLTVSLASTTGFSTSYASSTLGYIGSLFLPSVSQGYSYIGSNGLLNTISTSTLFSQINLFDLDTNTPFGTPLNSVYRIRSSFNNFLSNSSFESWLSGTSVAPSGWTLAGDATVSRSSTATINSYSAQVVFGTANTGELYQVIDTSTLVDYTFSAYVQRTSGTGNARLVAQRADAPFTEFVSVPLSTGGGWQLITLTVKPSAGTQTRFAIKSSDAVASTWLIDEAMFQEGKNLASTWLPAYIDDTNNQQVYGSKTFNALQTFNYSSSTIYSSFLTASSTFLNAGSITLATTTAGTVKTTSSGLFYVDTSAGGGGGVTSVTATYPIISSGGTTPAISIAFSTTTANIWSALNTFNGGLTIGTTTAGILRTNASGVVYASTATTTMSLFNDFTIPDSSGDVWLAPNSINSANSVSDQMVFVASSSVAKVGIHGSILIPSNFSSSSAKVRFAWTATSTSNAVVNDFDYRCVSGNNTTSLYQTSWQENKTVTTNNPSTAGYRITSTMDINAGYYCSAGDTMQFFLTRDGTDGSDTSTVDQEIFSASIDLLTQ